jgi:mono/diheme cytochrome c family protein
LRGFILGIVLSLLLIVSAAYFYPTTGHFDTRSVGNTPGSLETNTAHKSLAKWVGSHSPKQTNPFPPTMSNLEEGSVVYEKNCATCHGSLKQPISPMHTKFYPPVPQFMTFNIHGPENNMFYIAKYGVRYTAMPGWDGVLSDDDLWKAVGFIKHWDLMKGKP